MVKRGRNPLKERNPWKTTQKMGFSLSVFVKGRAVFVNFNNTSPRKWDHPFICQPSVYQSTGFPSNFREPSKRPNLARREWDRPKKELQGYKSPDPFRFILPLMKQKQPSRVFLRSGGGRGGPFFTLSLNPRIGSSFAIGNELSCLVLEV